MNKPKRSQGVSLFLALLLLASPLASAQTTEKSRDWDISSSSIEASLSDGHSIYRGEPGNPAVFTYGDLKIEGDPITMTLVESDLTLLTALGTPAIMQQADEDGNVYTASASSIHYDNVVGSVTLEGDAKITGPDGINFTACFIEYVIDTNSVRARACSPDERANLSMEQEDTE